MISVVVPAHNEAAVLPRLLDALAPGIDADRLAVVVIANGCVDDTADVARAAGPGVTVLEVDAGDKVGALNAGDAASDSFPRFYVDADVVVSASDLDVMAARLVAGVEAVAPSLHLDDRASSWPVRSYHRYWATLPPVRHSLAGRGCFGVTGAGRDRWGEFPPVVADDQFVNQMFDRSEVAIAEDVTSTVTTPTSLRALILRKRRSHRGNLELAADGSDAATSRREWIQVLRTDPRRVIDLPVFLAVTAAVRLSAWRERRTDQASWGSDASSRRTT